MSRYSNSVTDDEGASHVQPPTREPPLTPPDYPPGTNPALTYLDGLANGSRQTQLSALSRIASLASHDTCDVTTLPWHQLRYRHTSALRHQLAAQLAPSTVNRYLSAVRSVLKEAWRLELMTIETYMRAADLRPVRGERLPRGRSLEQEEIQALLNACSGTRVIDRRDHAILSVLIGSGLRRQELAGLDVQDVSLEHLDLVVRSGKGDRDGVVPLAGWVACSLEVWLRTLGADGGPLFVTLSRTGRMLGRRLSIQGVRLVLERRASAAGVEQVTCHDCRRTFVSTLLENGADLSTTQQLARHASVGTTQRYDRRGDRARRAAVGRLEP